MSTKSDTVYAKEYESQLVNIIVSNGQDIFHAKSTDEMMLQIGPMLERRKCHSNGSHYE